MSQSPINARLDLFSEWATDLPLKFLWVVHISNEVTIDNINIILGKGSGVNARYERRNTHEWPIKYKSLEELSHPTFGFLLAQKLTLPNESYNITNTVIKNNAGFLPGMVSGNRTGYGAQNGLSLDILETNYDAIDYFIKPWIIAASHKGLIEDGGPSVKCEINAYLFTKDSNTYYPNKEIITVGERVKVRKLQLRKHITFERCVPYQVGPNELNYDDLPPPTQQVSFAFERCYTNNTNLINV